MGDQNEKYMAVALRLARGGVGSVEPNPAVGCVIVKNDEIIGEGLHKKFGGAHAEINALEDCRKRDNNPDGAVMYVTLEPCCHQGKTGPCTDAIIESRLAKVVIAMVDPSEHANGRGIEQLRSAGIEVQTGICENQAGLLNAPFIKFATTGQCWVIVKWAQSVDCKLAYADKSEGRWISNEKSRKNAHKLRRRAGAILVGINTVLADDPLLTARPAKGKNPIRIILDTKLRISLDCKLLATTKKTSVLIITSAQAVETNPEKVEKINRKGAEVLTVATAQGRCDIDLLLDELAKRGVQQLLVEGGPEVITSFLKRKLADEFVIYIAPKALGQNGTAEISQPMADLAKAVGLHNTESKRLGDDIRLSG